MVGYYLANYSKTITLSYIYYQFTACIKYKTNKKKKKSTTKKLAKTVKAILQSYKNFHIFFLFVLRAINFIILYENISSVQLSSTLLTFCTVLVQRSTIYFNFFECVRCLVTDKALVSCDVHVGVKTTTGACWCRSNGYRVSFKIFWCSRW